MGTQRRKATLGGAEGVKYGMGVGGQNVACFPSRLPVEVIDDLAGKCPLTGWVTTPSLL